MRREANRAIYSEHKIGEQQPGDEQGAWSRERLERMNDRFVEQVEKAIKRGSEHRPEPAPPSRPRRFA
jgi:hypothetical protein